MLPVYELNSNTTIIGLGLYIKPLDVLAIADLHIGYEEYLVEQGIYLPPLQLPELKKMLKDMIEVSNASKLVIVGDVKHEFGDISKQEWKETIELLNYLKKELKIEVHVVRGNHDNFLIGVLKRLEIPFHDPLLKDGEWVFVHGHKPLPVETFQENVKHIVMGHEHPAIILRDELGVKIKLKALLKGEYSGKSLFVLPAISPYMPGTEVNVAREFLSPVLNSVNISEFAVYAIDLEAGVYNFGTVKMLREIIQGAELSE